MNVAVEGALTPNGALTPTLHPPPENGMGLRGLRLVIGRGRFWTWGVGPGAWRAWLAINSMPPLMLTNTQKPPEVSMLVPQDINYHVTRNTIDA